MRPQAVPGFTIKEIMIGISLTGLVVAVVGPKVVGHHIDKQRARAASDIEQIVDSLQRFHADNGYYPSTGEGLDTLVNAHGRAPHPSHESYIDRIPTDPWGTPYAYLSNNKHFLLKSLGADGREGGEGTAADIDSNDLQT